MNTNALDQSYDRVGSVSPLKYRPRIEMVGLAYTDPFDRSKMRTPDPTSVNATPQRSNRGRSDWSREPTGRGPQNKDRSNSKRSILKSSRSHQYFDQMSPTKNIIAQSLQQE